MRSCVSGQLPVASYTGTSVSVWAEEGAERLGVESCLERACVHRNSTGSFVRCVASAWSGRKARSKHPAASDTEKRRAGGQAGQDIDVCFYLLASALLTPEAKWRFGSASLRRLYVLYRSLYAPSRPRNHRGVTVDGTARKNG